MLALVTFLVPDYEDGLRFFVDGLGWTCLGDEDQGRKRRVTVAPTGGGTGLVLALPTTARQSAALGGQTGDRVGFFLETRDFDADAGRIIAAGGTFLEAPRLEPYGKVAQWRDPWGNLWDLIERP
ncbi:MAG: lactoylglutathione lyase-related protein [Rhodobacteraceae bacterium HLUCCO18]|nr:MAG: lactoylglutathione lyase-related protein [Rhodobacteraceae bacterium HLUCCO18]